MKRSIVILMAALVFSGATLCVAPAEAAGSAVVGLRIEGLRENMYINGALAVSYGGDGPILGDVIESYNAGAAAPIVTGDGGRIIQVGPLAEKTAGGAGSWSVMIEGLSAGQELGGAAVAHGDDIVLYYGDAARMQKPEIDLTRMLGEGIVRITGGANDPIAGADVLWDGMRYTTDANGEIIIDSTGGGVAHTVQVERYDDAGLPTVLRFAPGHTVRYGYSDVFADDWYYDAVIAMWGRGLIRGVTEEAFAPSEAMNRAMFVTVLGRMAGVGTVPADATGFSDVVDDGWSAGYIAWAAQTGVVTGYDGGIFGQYRSVTREQIAVMLHRYGASGGYADGLAAADMSAFSDAGAVSAYAREAVEWAVQANILQGYGGRLGPGDTATRAQVAAMLDRYIVNFAT